MRYIDIQINIDIDVNVDVNIKIINWYNFQIFPKPLEFQHCKNVGICHYKSSSFYSHSVKSSVYNSSNGVISTFSQAARQNEFVQVNWSQVMQVLKSGGVYKKLSFVFDSSFFHPFMRCPIMALRNNNTPCSFHDHMINATLPSSFLPLYVMYIPPICT